MKVNEVDVVLIPSLPELTALPAGGGDVPIYNGADNILYRIKAALLGGGSETAVKWNISTTYAADVVVEFGLKLWLSLAGGNTGNTPVDGVWWTEVSKSTANGFGYWAPGVFTVDPSMVLVDGVIFYLDNNLVTFPFNSTDFYAELALNKWKVASGNMILALTSDVEVAIPTEDIKYLSPKKAFDGFLFWVNNTLIPELATASKKIIGAINELYNSIWVRQPVFVGICQKCPILSTDITRDDTTRTLTINTTNGGTLISPTNPIRFYTNNGNTPTMHEKHTTQSVQWSDIKGLKYIYFDTDGILKSSDTGWDFSNITTIWRLYWNPSLTGANRIVREAIEYHVNTISAIDHRWKHRYGTVWLSGFEMVANASLAGTPNASGLNTCISLTGGVAMDDNMPYTVINSITPSDFSQDLGMTTAANITISNAGVFDITYNATDGTLSVIPGTRFPFHFIAEVPQIITAGGIITPVSANYFFNYYIYSFQDPRFGKVINARSGGQYASKAEADAETWELIKAASPTLQDGEVRQLYKTTWERKTAFSSDIKQSALRSFVDLRQNAAIAITAAGASGVSLASNVVVDATGFDGNLDNTVTNGQILAQKVDDLEINMEVFSFEISDTSTPFTTGAKQSVYWPYNFTLSSVMVSVETAPTGGSVIFDLHGNDGITIFSTRPSIDAGEFTTETAAVPSVVSTTTFTKGQKLTPYIDQVGSTVKGAGGIIYLIGKKS